MVVSKSDRFLPAMADGSRSRRFGPVELVKDIYPNIRVLRSSPYGSFERRDSFRFSREDGGTSIARTDDTGYYHILFSRLPPLEWKISKKIKDPQSSLIHLLFVLAATLILMISLNVVHSFCNFL
jgi:hypothetical protein